MAMHGFGIMDIPPAQGKRYDEYEPQKYNCIYVQDEYVEGITASFSNLDFYWHSLDVKGKGLAYCGITLIPPDLLPLFIDVINDIPALGELNKLCEKAEKQNKWIIHFGV